MAMKRKEFSTTAQVAVGVVVAFVVLIALINGCAAGSAPSDGEDALAGEPVMTTGTVSQLHECGRASVAECAEGGETISPIPTEYATTEELERAGYRPLRGTVTRRIVTLTGSSDGQIIDDVPGDWVTLTTVQLWDEPGAPEVAVYSNREYACPLNYNGDMPMFDEQVAFWGMQREQGGDGVFASSTDDAFTCLVEGEIHGLGGGDGLGAGPHYRKIPRAWDVLNDTQTK